MRIPDIFRINRSLPEKKIYNWHPWFAWYPVKLDCHWQYAWLETVMRKRAIVGAAIDASYEFAWSYYVEEDFKQPY